MNFKQKEALSNLISIIASIYSVKSKKKLMFILFINI